MTTTAHQQAARAYAATFGVPYAEARRLTTHVPDPYGRSALTREELGVRELGSAATPAQRAHAEASWRPAPDHALPCRCSGGCEHGDQLCPVCENPLIHYDRYPGSLWAVTEWADDYLCPQCESLTWYQVGVTLEALPWGELIDRGVTTYPGIRHPNFPD